MSARHIVIDTYGYRLGLKSARVSIKEADGGNIREFPLSKLKSLTITSTGVGISSDLLRELATRGIPLHLVDFKGEVVSSLSGVGMHGTARIRALQFNSVADSRLSRTLACSLIKCKLSNQRVVLLYFQKYLRKANRPQDEITKAIEGLSQNYIKQVDDLANLPNLDHDLHWRHSLFGIEGAAARLYWEALRQSALLPEGFHGRVGRGATDSINHALNYGYAILGSHLWRAVSIAGLEPYAGILHVERSGKPSLVLDLMEEYRPWVVDRLVVTMRSELSATKGIDQTIKRRIIDGVNRCLRTEVSYRGHRVLLDTLIQRQVFRFAGSICTGKPYRGFVFKW